MSDYLLIKDIRRCPYHPNDNEYKEWMRNDDERIQAIIRARKELHINSFKYLSHTDRGVVEMAIFISSFFNLDQ